MKILVEYQGGSELYDWLKRTGYLNENIEIFVKKSKVIGNPKPIAFLIPKGTELFDYLIDDWGQGGVKHSSFGICEYGELDSETLEFSETNNPIDADLTVFDAFLLMSRELFPEKLYEEVEEKMGHKRSISERNYGIDERAVKLILTSKHFWEWFFSCLIPYTEEKKQLKNAAVNPSVLCDSLSSD